VNISIVVTEKGMQFSLEPVTESDEALLGLVGKDWVFRVKRSESRIDFCNGGWMREFNYSQSGVKRPTVVHLVHRGIEDNSAHESERCVIDTCPKNRYPDMDHNHPPFGLPANDPLKR
jgi:hypothetical protein